MTRVPSAKPPIRVALLGFGYWGPNYARVLHEVPQVDYLHATRPNRAPSRQDVNAAWDLAPHDVAIFNYLLDAQPLWASAIGTCALRTNRDDIVFATLGYRNEVVANIHVSWADPNK